jgi:hypothetical protein
MPQNGPFMPQVHFHARLDPFCVAAAMKSASAHLFNALEPAKRLSDWL